MRNALVGLALLFSVPAFAVPMQLTHQGRIDDALGEPLEGVHALTVSIYEGPAGGAPLWTETIDATFDSGTYAIVLGSDSSNPLTGDVIDGSVRYVALQVADAPEMSPRIPLTSVPYAVRAGNAAVAESVQGGVVDASEIRIGGTTVIDSSGAVTGTISWDDIQGVPEALNDGDADTLASLSCLDGEIAVWSGVEWTCGEGVPSVIDVTTLSGTVDITNLPVGGGADQVAAGDHVHSFGQITGVAGFSQLPTGTGSNEVATGDHTHQLVDLGGDLPISRTTGDLPLSRTSGDLPISRTTGDLPISRTTGDLPISRTTGDLPISRTTGDLPLARTSGTLDAARISGTIAIGNLPIGSSSTSVSRGDHAHAFSAITGSVAITQLPTGTSGTTVALGNHNHDISTLTGTATIGQLPVGTSGTTVAAGNHTHDAGAIVSGTVAKARLPSDTVYANCSGSGQFPVWNGSAWVCQAYAPQGGTIYERSCPWQTHTTGTYATSLSSCTPAACASGHTDLGVSQQTNTAANAYDPWHGWIASVGGDSVRQCLIPPTTRAAVYVKSCAWTNYQYSANTMPITSCTPPACASGHTDLGTQNRLLDFSLNVQYPNAHDVSATAGRTERVCAYYP